MSTAVDPAAKAAFDSLVDEYEEVSRTLAATRAPRVTHEQARTQLSYARRAFRLAQLMAPAEGETHEGFDRQLDTVRKSLSIVRHLINA